MHVPVNAPIITESAKRYVGQAMESGWVSSAGKYIDLFEEKFAEFLGVKHAVTTTSGTSALHLGLASLGIGEGDEVIVPDFTMIASVFSVLYTGAKPVFVDSEPETFNIDVFRIEEKITERTKAIMPVHIYGHPVNMDPLKDIADRHRLFVIEDAAEVHGAKYKGKYCGSMGDVGCFSFYGNKIITTGEGGMVVTNDDALASRVRSLKDLAHSSVKRFVHEEVGYNYRMTNLQAACGLGQLEHVEEFLEKKKWMASEYEKRLKDIPGLRLPVTKNWAENVYWMYAILLERSFPYSRDEFRLKLKEKGVDTRDFFTSSSLQPALRQYGLPEERFPVTEDIARRGLYLPSGLALTEEQMTYVCGTIKELVGNPQVVAV
ncbi:aminotransferase DegT [Candidatus Peribacteria bacterium RIFCSPHIGHO2_02_FULL_49_16]|nr:MAG: aminotransferase DegT [Candidatus Peribacteria bacterium RIFCSPHIGHO2_01_FULL_49_38]OGJ58857.1 MAG: aminotransferase DegT [Candidatus Peribacteria bacterium RIFCSPHIGHO2_02_FULL_49_16]